MLVEYCPVGESANRRITTVEEAYRDMPLVRTGNQLFAKANYEISMNSTSAGSRAQFLDTGPRTGRVSGDDGVCRLGNLDGGQKAGSPGPNRRSDLKRLKMRQMEVDDNRNADQ
jgi:hypothetical protein